MSQGCQGCTLTVQWGSPQHQLRASFGLQDFAMQGDARDVFSSSIGTLYG